MGSIVPVGNWAVRYSPFMACVPITPAPAGLAMHGPPGFAIIMLRSKGEKEHIVKEGRDGANARHPEATARTSADPDVDWVEAANDPSFRTLISAKARFLVPALILSLGFYLLITVLAGLAPGFMAQRVIGPLSLGYLMVFATYIMAWGVALVYVRVANRSFDPKAADAVSVLHERQARREEKA